MCARNENSDKFSSDEYSKPYAFEAYESPYENDIYEDYMVITNRSRIYSSKKSSHSRTTGQLGTPVKSSKSSETETETETETDLGFECSKEESVPIDKPGDLPGQRFDQLLKARRFEEMRELLAENGYPVRWWPSPGIQVTGKAKKFYR